MSEKVEVINLPNTLRVKVGGKLGAVDADTIAKAEAALADLSTQFDQWLMDEVEKVNEAYAAVKAAKGSADSLERLYFCVHDLKGLGTTYGFPLVTRVAASFGRMCDEPEKRARAPMVLIAAHLDTINVMIRDQIKSENHPIGTVLAKTLEDRVKELLEKTA